MLSNILAKHIFNCKYWIEDDGLGYQDGI
jgi:hypothetical protein